MLKYIILFFLNLPSQRRQCKKDDQAVSDVSKVQKVTFQRRKGHQVQLERGFVFCDFTAATQAWQSQRQAHSSLQEGVVKCDWWTKGYYGSVEPSIVGRTAPAETPTPGWHSCPSPETPMCFSRMNRKKDRWVYFTYIHIYAYKIFTLIYVL